MIRIAVKQLIMGMLLVGLAAGPGFSTAAGSAYEWKLAAPAGNGCFPPKCDAGQFPMAVIPITGFGERLYSIGDSAVWTSADGINWDSQPKTDWGPRFGARFAFFNNKLWMLGGMRAWDDFRNDVWSSADGRIWEQVTDKSAWRERRGHGTVVFNNKLWIVGGSLSSGRPDKTPTQFLNDVWSSADGIHWDRVTAHAPWSARECGTTLVFDNQIWVVGGRGLNDVWSSVDGQKWQQQTANADFGPREAAGGAVFDGKIWVYGGVEKNDVWHSTDGKTWVRVFESAPWSTRSTVYSAVYKDRLMLFSGKTGRADTQQGEIWAMSRKTE